jgi:hypothetical protein
VLAIVQNDQRPAAGDVHGQRLGEGASAFLLYPERRADGLRHQPSIGKRRELDEPDAIGIVVHDVGRDLQ